MCTAAVGELIGSGSSAKVRKILAGGGAVLSMLAATLYFSYVSTAWATTSSVDGAAILRTSIAL
jgi:hypothetical protein